MFSNKVQLGLILTLCTLFSFTALFGQSETEAKNTAVMKRFYDEVVNQGKLDLIDELVADNFVDHEETPGIPADKAGLKTFMTAFRSAFPDLKFTVNDLAASGDKVWVYITITGTHKGTFMDIPATGKQISVNGFDIVRFADGKAVEHWGLTDSMTMMTQLGVMGEEGH